MNILIIGEFSGFAKHLKNGFRKLGHKVTVVMTPDSFKKIKGGDGDIVYGGNINLFGHPIKGTALLLKPLRALLIRYKLYRKYHNHKPDLIIVISSGFLAISFFQVGTPLKFLKKQVSRGSKIIMTECGGSPASHYNNQEFYRARRREVRIFDIRYNFLLKYSDVIIPTSYCYYDDLLKYNNYYSYNLNKVHRCIPLPITIDDECDSISCVGRKIVVFHGIIRPLDKGTSFIVEAMNRLQRDLPNVVECISEGGLPYDEYVKIFNRIDILVDQTYGNGWGMNAIIGAMKGKCVLAPCGPENSENMGIDEIPFVRIGPDSEQIYKTLKDLVLNPEKINEIKLASRIFAEKNCECSYIARRYLTVVGLG